MILRERIFPNGIKLFAPYYDELVVGKEKGCLPVHEYGAHALWNYYLLAAVAKDKADRCMVYEDELSPKFNLTIARRIFESLANLHGIPPDQMGKYWGVVTQQRIALGYNENAELPSQFKFGYN